MLRLVIFSMVFMSVTVASVASAIREIEVREVRMDVRKVSDDPSKSRLVINLLQTPRNSPLHQRYAKYHKEKVQKSGENTRSGVKTSYINTFKKEYHDKTSVEARFSWSEGDPGAHFNLTIIDFKTDIKSKKNGDLLEVTVEIPQIAKELHIPDKLLFKDKLDNYLKIECDDSACVISAQSDNDGV